MVWRVLVKGYFLVCRSFFMIERVFNESDGIFCFENNLLLDNREKN